MSELNATSSSESLSQPTSLDDEELSLVEMPAVFIEPAIGDRFEKRGRRVISWQVDAIAFPPHDGKIITFAEIDGTARLQVHAADIVAKGFNRLDSQQGA